jgi:hypothetical protein
MRLISWIRPRGSETAVSEHAGWSVMVSNWGVA